MKKVAIVGAGLAGFSVARKLRELGFSNSISLYGDEGMIPYDRPPLSKAYLLGETGRENLELRADSFFQQNEIGLFAQKKYSALMLSQKSSTSMAETSSMMLWFSPQELLSGSFQKV